MQTHEHQLAGTIQGGGDCATHHFGKVKDVTNPRPTQIGP